jgi:hypothetical protein
VHTRYEVLIAKQTRSHAQHESNCWKVCFLRDSCQGVINRTSLEFSAVVEYSPSSNVVNTKAEGFPWLGSVARKRLVRADCEDLASTVVIVRVAVL